MVSSEKLLKNDFLWKVAYFLSLKNIGSVKALQLASKIELNAKTEVVQAEISQFRKELIDNSYLKRLLGGYEIRLLSKESKDFPAFLKNISYPPVILFCIGNLNLLKKKLVCIVGTRKMSGYGKRIIDEICDIGKNDELVYVSGLALGVDSEVHKLALNCGIGTIAVVAGGIDVGFPKINEQLFREIINSGNGLIISEFPPGKIPVKGMFPMRNRILAAISDVMVIVEAGEKSGAMISARYAIEYGKSVATFPNDIFNNSFKGNNKLISEGCCVIKDEEDYIAFLNSELGVNIESKRENQLLDFGGLQDFDNNIVKTLEEILKTNQLEFSFDNFFTKLNEKGVFSEEFTERNLTKLEMQGILSVNNLGTYKINRL